MQPNDRAVEIGEVIIAELNDIARRRGEPTSLNRDPNNWEQECHKQKLLGVCISGGGIRSATFGLVVLQALAEKGILQESDYLSTVSGGGYIGAWLQGIFYRGPKSYDPLLRQVPGPSSCDPISFLRKFSNYLAPRVGLSLDAIVIPIIWVRNMVLNQAIVIAALIVLMLAALMPGAGIQAMATHGNVFLSWTFIVLALLSGAVAVITMGRNLVLITRREFQGTQDTAFKAGEATSAIGKLVTLPLILGVVFVLLAIACPRQQLGSWPGRIIACLLLWGLLAAMQWGGGFGACYVERRQRRWSKTLASTVAILHTTWISLVAASFTILLFYLVSTPLFYRIIPATAAGAHHSIAWVPPLYVLILLCGVSLQVGLMGQDFPDASREWLARVAAQLISVIFTWAALFAIAVFAPLWLGGLWLRSKTTIVSGVGAWLASTAASVYAGKSSKSGALDAEKQPTGSTLDLIARYGPFVAIPGILIAVALAVQLALHWQSINHDLWWPQFVSQYWTTFPFAWSQSSEIFWLMAFAAVVVFVLLSLRVNINEFSLHHFYKNRLVRCYLGASATATRVPDPFTGFDPKDDIALASLRKDDGDDTTRSRAPYPIVNATLTVTVGTELATQERKALPWMFTPRYSGFVPPRSDADRAVIGEKYLNKSFAKTEDILGGGVHLGTATAISGAAVNPNMGFHSAPQTAFLLTLFDVRLGWWIGNPRDKKTYARSGPRFSLWWLIRELLGSVDERTSYVNLSDGGHFENLGMYELVRRRCRFIIAVDSEEDPDYRVQSLGGAVRKCRSDFGVEIEIDPRPICLVNGHSASHCVVGRIHYPEQDSEAGWLLYLKSSLTGDEPADVEEYHREVQEFPQQSTLQQFFSESQFESYRRLGLHIGHTTLDHSEASLSLDDWFQRLSGR